MRVFDNRGQPVGRDYIPGEQLPEGWSIQPFFPGYTFSNGTSLYRGEEVGEGGYVYAEPGMYWDVALLDVASMHPSSIVAENLFGDVYTKRFKELLDARLGIKHDDLDSVRLMMDGALAPYLTDEKAAKELSKALKIPINSVYGLTSAAFSNPFRDPRNKDNIVAKRGALFMINLKHEVQKRGFTVAHIKTDSIKIPNATPEIIDFVMHYGMEYGYTFEHEATYDRMCLVNDAVYIAKYATADACKDLYGYVPEDCAKEGGKWTATGTQFQVPYVFKTLFSREPIIFQDICETKSVSSALFLDMNEGYPDVSDYEKERLTRKKIDSKDTDDKERASLIKKLNPEFKNLSDWEIRNEIKKGHNYIFVGRVGSFCPIRKGAGGGLLLRKSDVDEFGNDIFVSATGAKEYRWMESEMVLSLNKEDDVDRSYYDRLVDDAIATISKYGDFEWFISDDSTK